MALAMEAATADDLFIDACDYFMEVGLAEGDLELQEQAMEFVEDGFMDEQGDGQEEAQPASREDIAQAATALATEVAPSGQAVLPECAAEGPTGPEGISMPQQAMPDKAEANGSIMRPVVATEPAGAHAQQDGTAEAPTPTLLRTSAGSSGRSHATSAKRRLFLPGARRVLLWDKLSFLLGCTCMWVCSFWLGHAPSTFYLLYTGLGMVLFSARFAVYRARKWHYYLLDLCYACNALLMYHLWAQPRQPLLARATFAFNTGPLTTSILAFRNSLVFHDMDKVTSLFLHLVPACVSWAQRWHPREKFGDVNSGPAGLVDLVMIPLAFYTIWALSYFLIIFAIAKERIKRRGYITLFSYVTTQKRGMFAAITRRVPQPVHVPVYLGLHMCFCGVSMLLAYLAWRSFILHTALLIIASSYAIWHGAGYYFEVFAKRYHMPVSADGASTVTTPPATPRPHSKHE